MSDVYLGYGNLLQKTPQQSSGVTNAALLASEIIAEKATLAANAFVDFYIQPDDPIQLVGVSGLSVIPNTTASVTFAFGAGLGQTDYGSKTLSINVVKNYHTYTEVLATEINVVALYCRVSFTNCNAVGLCWASTMLNPEVGIALGASRNYRNFSRVTTSSLTGASSRIFGPQAREYSLKFDFVDSETQFPLFDDFIQDSGNSKQVMIIPGFGDSRKNRDNMVGYIEDGAGTSFVQPYLQDWTMNFREAL